jgi:hypothetical protein
LLFVRFRLYEPGPKLPGTVAVTAEEPQATPVRLVPAKDTAGGRLFGHRFVPLMVIWSFAVFTATLEMVGALAPQAKASQQGVETSVDTARTSACPTPICNIGFPRTTL